MDNLAILCCSIGIHFPETLVVSWDIFRTQKANTELSALSYVKKVVEFEHGPFWIHVCSRVSECSVGEDPFAPFVPLIAWFH